MKYGHFDDRNREYVITQPDTPLPWINYLGCQAYFGIISNTAGGYSFYRDARLRRLTRYRYNNAPMDFGGRYVYLRDDESREFWSPSWQPTRHALLDYSCHNGNRVGAAPSRWRRPRRLRRHYGIKIDPISRFDRLKLAKRIGLAPLANISLRAANRARAGSFCR